ncbi:hypothetical protein C8Q80DRAFT_4382 [Daedaleopsis nitida]|nr:hypothetical protein C8Q80DRAFT_4382 [Daedaleopsis nitida]
MCPLRGLAVNGAEAPPTATNGDGNGITVATVAQIAGGVALIGVAAPVLAAAGPVAVLSTIGSMITSASAAGGGGGLRRRRIYRRRVVDVCSSVGHVCSACARGCRRTWRRHLGSGGYRERSRGQRCNTRLRR